MHPVASTLGKILRKATEYTKPGMVVRTVRSSGWKLGTTPKGIL